MEITLLSATRVKIGGSSCGFGP